MTTDASCPIELFLVTGFLGSGKTTLIKALLSQPAMTGTAVVVNEFGAVGIDNAIFAETIDNDKIYLLANGCLCCSAGDDLVRTLSSLVQLDDHPRRIVVETSGLADPGAVLQRLITDARVSNTVRIAGVVTTIDGVNGAATLDSQAVAIRQAAVADQRIITKSDIADEEEIADLERRLREMNPGASLRFVNHGDIDANELLASLTFDPFAFTSKFAAWLSVDAYRAVPQLHRVHAAKMRGIFSAEPAIQSWLVEADRPLDWNILSGRIAQIIGRHGDVILRMKGVVDTHGDDSPMVLHAVQRLFHPPMRLTVPGYRGGSSIVVIGDGRAAEAVDGIRKAMSDAVVWL
jgi:G3E family GTPase